jgi:5-methylcytosine-specific restriction endonuclease McrA
MRYRCERSRMESWQLAHARKRPYRKHVGDVCARCGFVAEDLCQLDVHHKDGDHDNNDPANLETLCANCHRLEHKREGTP